MMAVERQPGDERVGCRWSVEEPGQDEKATQQRIVFDAGRRTNVPPLGSALSR